MSSNADHEPDAARSSCETRERCPRLALPPTGSRKPARVRPGYFACRTCDAAAGAGWAFFFAARSSSQIVIGAAMNQVE